MGEQERCLTCWEHGSPFDGPCPHCGYNRTVEKLEEREKAKVSTMPADLRTRAREILDERVDLRDLDEHAKGAISKVAEALATEHAAQAVAAERERLRNVDSKKVMMAMAKKHDQIVSEREQGAASALRVGNGIAIAYWREIARAAVRTVRTAIRNEGGNHAD